MFGARAVREEKLQSYDPLELTHQKRKSGHSYFILYTSQVLSSTIHVSLRDAAED
jgi:hypothetical protein